VVEDSPEYAELAVRVLRAEGFTDVEVVVAPVA
jgi:hypothetical protein